MNLNVSFAVSCRALDCRPTSMDRDSAELGPEEHLPVRLAMWARFSVCLHWLLGIKQHVSR